MASALAKVDHFKSQQSSSSSRRISSGLGSATPTEDELLIIKPNDTTVLSEESDTRAKHKLVAHESAAMVPQVDVMNRWGDEELHSLHAPMVADSSNVEEPNTNVSFFPEESGSEKSDFGPRMPMGNNSTENPTSPKNIMLSSPSHHDQTQYEDPLVSVEPSSLRAMKDASAIYIMVPTPYEEDQDAMEKPRPSSAPELSSSHEETPIQRPFIYQFDSSTAEDGHPESEATSEQVLADNLKGQRMTGVKFEAKHSPSHLPSTSDYLSVKPINISNSTSERNGVALPAESLTPRVSMTGAYKSTERSIAPTIGEDGALDAITNQAASTDVLAPLTPKQNLSTPSLDDMPSTYFSEKSLTIEESRRLTPRLDQEDDQEMLRSRLEIGLGPVDISVSPEILVRSPSTVALPPTTPHVAEDFTELAEAEPLVNKTVEDIDISTAVYFNNEVTSSNDGIDTPGAGQLGGREYIDNSDTSLAGIARPLKSPVVNPILVGETPMENGLTKSFSLDAEWEDNVKTPLAAPRHILDTESRSEPAETPSNPADPANISSGATAANQGATLQITGLSKKDPSGLERSISVISIPPTSPREKFDPNETIIATPVVMPKGSQETATNASSLDVAFPTVTIIPSNSPSEDFVEDARSERSVGTSVAPIAPNSPRFITPYLTPSLDSAGLALLEIGQSSSEATTAQPLTQLAVDALPIAEDNASELVPELKDALDTSFISHYDHSTSGAPLTAPVEGSDGFVLTTVSENSNQTSHEAGQGSSARPSRPRHTSTPSWSIQRSSGWFHSVPNAPGRPSLEIVEGEFSRPPSGKYPPTSARETQVSRDESRCIIL